MRPTVSRNHESTRRDPSLGRTPAHETEVNRNYYFSSQANDAAPNTRYDFSRNAASPRITAADMAKPLLVIQAGEAAVLRKVIGQDHVIPELVRHIYQHVRRGLTVLEGQDAREQAPTSPPAILSGPSGVGKQTTVAAIADAFSLPLVALESTGGGTDDLAALAETVTAVLCSRGRDLYLEHHSDQATRTHARGERTGANCPPWAPQGEDLLNRQIDSFGRLFGVLLVKVPGPSDIELPILRAEIDSRLEQNTDVGDGSTVGPLTNLLVLASTTTSADSFGSGQQRLPIFTFRRLERTHLETIAAREMGQLAGRLNGTAYPDLTRIGKLRIRRGCVGVIADNAIRYGTARAVQRTIGQLPALLSAHVRRTAVNGASTEELEVTGELLRQLFRDSPGRAS